MSEGTRRPEGDAPGQGKRAPGRGPHPLLALLPRYAAHGDNPTPQEHPADGRHPADAWGSR